MYKYCPGSVSSSTDNQTPRIASLHTSPGTAYLDIEWCVPDKSLTALTGNTFGGLQLLINCVVA
ncbi:uncharacterized protein K441DRAFT_661243, partial [Cenococcum geophilum 1.58]|uniref:uncharacterized protein n=1 Tax=Cenococcum geophilum 1.58 TaxID=794803 RepID=UPI00358EC68D